MPSSFFSIYFRGGVLLPSTSIAVCGAFVELAHSLEAIVKLYCHDDLKL